MQTTSKTPPEPKTKDAKQIDIKINLDTKSTKDVQNINVISNTKVIPDTKVTLNLKSDPINQVPKTVQEPKITANSKMVPDIPILKMVPEPISPKIFPETKKVQEPKITLNSKMVPEPQNPKLLPETKTVQEPKLVQRPKLVQGPKLIFDTKITQDPKITPNPKVAEDPKRLLDPKRINEITLKTLAPKMANETTSALPKGGNQKINTKVLSSASVHGDSDGNKPRISPKIGDFSPSKILEQIKEAPVETVVLYFAPFVAISLFVMVMWIFKRKKSTGQKMNQILKDLNNDDMSYTDSKENNRNIIPLWNDNSIDNSLSDSGLITDEQYFRIGNGENIEDICNEDIKLKQLVIPTMSPGDTSLTDSPITLHRNEDLSFSIPVYNLGDELDIHDDSMKTLYSEKSTNHNSKKSSKIKTQIKDVFSKKKSKKTNDGFVRTLAVLDNQNGLPSMNVTQFTGKEDYNIRTNTVPLPTSQNHSNKNHDSTNNNYSSNHGTNNTDITMLNHSSSTRSQGSNDTPRTIQFTAQSEQTMYDHGSNQRQRQHKYNSKFNNKSTVINLYELSNENEDDYEINNNYEFTKHQKMNQKPSKILDTELDSNQIFNNYKVW